MSNGSQRRGGILYGFLKIHKLNAPLRPIHSSVNHYSYKLAKFFIPLLTLISINSFTVKDSLSFVQELVSSDIDANKVVIASFEVPSLFINIPLHETINIICNRITSNCQRFQVSIALNFENFSLFP